VIWTREFLELAEFDPGARTGPNVVSSCRADAIAWMDQHQMWGKPSKECYALVVSQRDSGEMPESTARDWVKWYRGLQKNPAALRACGDVVELPGLIVVTGKERTPCTTLDQGRRIRERWVCQQSQPQILAVRKSLKGQHLVQMRRGIVMPWGDYQVFDPLSGQHTRCSGRAETLAVSDQVAARLRQRAERRSGIYKQLHDAEGFYALERIE